MTRKGFTNALALIEAIAIMIVHEIANLGVNDEIIKQFIISLAASFVDLSKTKNSHSSFTRNVVSQSLQCCDILTVHSDKNRKTMKRYALKMSFSSLL